MASIYWSEVGGGEFRRPAGASEVAMRTAADQGIAIGREQWAINTIATFSLDMGYSPDDATEPLRVAWLWTRYEAPFIAAEMENDAWVYQVPDEKAIQSWLTQSFRTEDSMEVNDFLQQGKPERFSCLHWFPKLSTVVIRVHHWNSDGIGCINLLDLFLRQLAHGKPAPAFGEESARLPPTLQELADFPLHSDPRDQAFIDGYYNDFIKSLPSTGFPYNPPLDSIGGTKRVSLSLESEATRELKRLCREQNLTVTTAAHAALAIATRDFAAADLAGKNFSSVLYIDYRPRSQYSNAFDRARPLGNLMLALPFTQPAGCSFKETATSLYTAYHQPVGKGSRIHGGYAGLTENWTVFFRSPLPEGSPLPSSPQLSSLGRLEEKLQTRYSGKHEIGLDDVEIVSDCISPVVLMYLWSWNGCLRISFCFNESYYATEWLEEVLRKVLDILKNEILGKEG